MEPRRLRAGAIEVVEIAEEEPAFIMGLGPDDIGGEAEEQLLRQANRLSTSTA
jgi:hypothetical protein